MNPDQEKELIEQIKAGDKSAFETLFLQYKDLVFSVCCRFIENKDEADDASQDIFIKIYNYSGSFRYDSKLSTWIYRICVNHCLNILRNKKKFRLLSLDSLMEKFGWQEKNEPADESADLHEMVENKEKSNLINEALSSLPEKQKTALILNKYDNLTNTEIAKIMDCSVSSVDSLIFRAKQNISKKLSHYFKKK